MAFEARITQRDIARRLGLSQVTVSRALAKNPLVAPETLQRVQAEAKKIGYRPDPVLASLNAWRRTKRPVSRGNTLAWIAPEKPVSGESWFSGARERAETLGYGIEVFSQSTPSMTMPRLASILRHRGIPGIVIAPQHSPRTRLDLDLDAFSAVTIGYSLESPVVDRVITDHHHNAIVAFMKLHAAGYRRIAMITSAETESRIEGRRIGAYKYMLGQHPRVASEIPVFQTRSAYSCEPDARDFGVWIKKWRPDSLLVYQPGIVDLCQNMGIRVPADIAILSLALTPWWANASDWAGLDEQVAASGAFAIDVLVSRLRANERGLPAVRRVHLIEGKWQDGGTMKRQAPQRPAARRA